jgi:hypothetical protein
MKISIDNPNRLDDFVGFLRDGGCIALRLDDCTVEALVPRVASPLSEQRELATYLKSWQSTHRSASTHAAVEAASPKRALAVAV